jgi:hypothetical protein
MIVQYAMILACRMGLALTSPAKSAQQAFALGRNLLIDKNCAHDNPQTFSHFSNFVGVLGALVSLALTAVMWTIALPLALGALVTAIPAVLSAITWVAQIPFIATSLAWVSSLPIVTGSMTLLNGLFGTVGIALAAAFGPAVGALAYVISVQVPAVALAVGATLGLIVAPVAALLSLGADKLSDLWATWIESGPFTKLKSLKFGGSNTSEFRKTWHVLGTAPQTPLTEEPIETAYLYNDTSIDRKCSFVVSTEALDLVDQNKHLVGQTKLCGAMAAGCLNKAKTIDSGYRLATPQEQGAPQNTKPDPARSVGSLNPSTSDGE